MQDVLFTRQVIYIIPLTRFKFHFSFFFSLIVKCCLCLKAIIQYLSGHPEKQVEETFNRFREIQIGLQWPGSSEECETHEVTLDEFKKVLESLKQEIQDSTKINIENSTPLDKQH